MGGADAAPTTIGGTGESLDRRMLGDGSESWKVIGDSTEGAMVVAALKAGNDPDDRNYPVLFEIPFDSDRKAMSVVVRGGDGTLVMYTKGAPEMILAKCTMEQRNGRDEPLPDGRPM